MSPASYQTAPPRNMWCASARNINIRPNAKLVNRSHGFLHNLYVWAGRGVELQDRFDGSLSESARKLATPWRIPFRVRWLLPPRGCVRQESPRSGRFRCIWHLLRWDKPRRGASECTDPRRARSRRRCCLEPRRGASRRMPESQGGVCPYA